MVKEIPLQNGMFALVDDEDYERCMEHLWANKGNHQKQVVSYINGKVVPLKEFILKRKSSKGKLFYQKNKNWLDFTKENLIEVDRSFIRSSGPANKKSSSKYKGVSFDKNKNKWSVYLRINGKNTYLGKYISEDEAARVYNNAVLKHLGPHAYMNEIGVDNRTKETDLLNPSMGRKRPSRSQKFLGITKTVSGYKAQIVIEKKHYYLGHYKTEIEAALAYDKKAKELLGDKAILNFPDGKE